MNAEDFGPKGVTGQPAIMIQPGEPYQDIFTGGSGFSGVYNAEPFTDLNANKLWDPGEPFTDTIPPKRIHVKYWLKLPADKREAAERAHSFHAMSCPVYRSIYKAIDITTELELREA